MTITEYQIRKRQTREIRQMREDAAIVVVLGTLVLLFGAVLARQFGLW